MKIPNLKKKLIFVFLIIAIAIIMYLLDIKCLFKELFSIPCPGCGITRAFISVFHLDFKKAFEFNPVFWMAPILFLLLLFEGKPLGKPWVNTLLYICIGIGFLGSWIYNLIRFY